MNNVPIKIKDTELEEIKTLQTKFQTLHRKFGDIGIEKLQLDALIADFIEREKKVKEEWSALQKSEQELLDRFVRTYGTGNLNMTDGTFTSVPE